VSIQRRASATIFEPPNDRGDAVLNCVDGCIPSDLATGTTPEIEEERRLLYVAMTRAKDHLHLIVPQRFFARQQHGGGDRHMYASRTRFIPCACRKSNPGISVMESAQDRATKYVPCPLNSARYWRILLNG
jgi:hypothetical protein